MYEYKFVKYVFPADAVLHGSFEVSYAEDHDRKEYFGYHQVIKEYAQNGWRLNSVVPFTDPEVKGQSAGFRTHMLVALGATIIALIQIEAVNLVLKIVSANPSLPKFFRSIIRV